VANVLALHPLLLKLAAIQDNAGLSHRAFARKLGITNGQWSHVRAGTSSMGRKTLRAVARTFPQLETEVLSYLRDHESTANP
jgi:transcriptional regulator with XRE-family HTH domain